MSQSSPVVTAADAGRLATWAADTVEQMLAGGMAADVAEHPQRVATLSFAAHGQNVNRMGLCALLAEALLRLHSPGTAAGPAVSGAAVNGTPGPAEPPGRVPSGSRAQGELGPGAVPPPPPDQVPAAMVEAAARALHEHTPLRSSIEDDPRDPCYRGAEIALAAALAGCEVREEWGHRSHWTDGTDHDSWHLSRPLAEQIVSDAGAIPRSLIRRLEITTSIEEGHTP